MFVEKKGGSISPPSLTPSPPPPQALDQHALLILSPKYLQDIFPLPKLLCHRPLSFFAGIGFTVS